jgi:hypothetical protein
MFREDSLTIAARNALIVNDGDVTAGTTCRVGSDVYTCVSVGAGSGAACWSPRHNYAATAAPAVTDDLDLGYKVGSEWIDVTNDKAYVCVDASDGAAVWSQTSVRTADTISALTTTDMFLVRDDSDSGDPLETATGTVLMDFVLTQLAARPTDTIATLADGDMFLCRDDSDAGDPVETVTASVLSTYIAAEQNIVAGAWSGAAVAGTNCAVGSVTGNYIRIGDRVFFSGAVASVNPTAAVPTATDFEVPIPVASNFTATTEASGSGSSTSAFSNIVITSSIANDRLVVNCSAVVDATESVHLVGSYVVL